MGAPVGSSGGTVLRILRAPPLRLVLLGAPLFLMMAQTNFFLGELAGAPLAATGVVLGMGALGLLLYIGFVRLVEGRPATELALPGMARELGIGALLGAGLYTGCVLVLMLVGVYRVEGLNPLVFLLPAIPLALSAGLFEELVFRGVLFRVLEEWMGSWVALALSSLVFGLMHLINPAATLTGALFISVEAGLLLAAAYMLTRRLWMSMGLHMAWNYTQSAIFSGIVSGSDSAPGLIRPSLEGPLLLTGGSFGLEASLPAFLFCTAAGVVLLVLAMRRGDMRPAGWRWRG